LNALDLQSYQFIELLLSLSKPQPPVVFEDAVVFTADGRHNRKVGVAFAHEQFQHIYWFKKILVPVDQTEPFVENAKKEPERLRDSGMLFYAYQTPPNLSRLEYRLIVDGLWVSDPSNPVRRTDMRYGLELSVTDAPEAGDKTGAAPAGQGGLNLRYTAASGESITVAGDFNAWDQFMYRLKETRSGDYRLELPLPAGTYHYIFYKNGERVLDPGNQNKKYLPSGKVVNTVVID
jgi:hypothetical protein